MAAGESAPRGRFGITNWLVKYRSGPAPVKSQGSAYHSEGMRIVIAGGTGLLGRALVERLETQGHAVAVLSRQPRTSRDVLWHPEGPPERLAPVLRGADALVNLAGASIAQRWTTSHKAALWESRVPLTRRLVQAIGSTEGGPRTLISGSAVGYYGPHGDEPLTESEAHGSDFLASMAEAWEREALAAAPAARVVLLRTGIVLDRSGGALPQMARPIRWFVGGPIGSGRQYLSWIHRDDWVSMVVWALTNEAVSGPLNVTAPTPATNLDFTRALGAVLRRPTLLPAPGFALRAVLGEMADLILTGQRVVPARALELGFEFQYPVLDAALRDALSRGSQRV
jgi:uncharacterized protein (TIGR01777 family)